MAKFCRCTLADSQKVIMINMEHVLRIEEAEKSGNVVITFTAASGHNPNKIQVDDSFNRFVELLN